MKRIGLCGIISALLTTAVQAQPPTTTTLPSAYMPIDSANIMIQSYLTSVASDSNSLLSLIADAQALRTLLADTSIKDVKVMFAHTQAYINSGNQGKPTSCNNGNMTLILVGVDRAGNYVFGAGANIINRFRPCPYYCPLGTAANSLLE